jgi:starch synthase
MSSPLNVLYVTPELAPHAKSGELADVAGALPKSLADAGHAVTVVLPYYRCPGLESLAKERLETELRIPLGSKRIRCRVYRAQPGNFDLYLIDHRPYFWREHIYGTGKEEYLDNDERFTFFCRAVLELLSETEMPVEIIHANNWPAALIPVLARTHYRRVKKIQRAACVLSLHNVLYQGAFPLDSLELSGLTWRSLDARGLTLNGRFNFLKTGITYADALHTVSSGYRRDILTARHGFGLNRILNERRDHLFAIRNGIDTDLWDPGRDTYIASPYSPPDFEGKWECRRDLIEVLKLDAGKGTCIISMLSNFTAHKGFDLLVEALDRILSLDVALVILGQGESHFEQQLRRAQARWPGRLSVRLGFSPWMLHKVLAGADAILIPSRYEPCGLNQMYGFRYGTVPVVRHTGGLKETVRPYSPRRGGGDGFVFREYTVPALIQALKSVVKAHDRPEVWRRIMRAGARRHVSWNGAAKRYTRLYEKALKTK